MESDEAKHYHNDSRNNHDGYKLGHRKRFHIAGFNSIRSKLIWLT